MYYFFTNFLIIYSLCNLGIGNPMFGQNVKMAAAGNFAYVVSIARKNFLDDAHPENDHVCSGTFITKKDVLTAAHCEDRVRGHVTEVRFASTDLRTTMTFPVIWWMSYAAWMASKNKRPKYLENDIAVVRVGGEIPDNMTYIRRGNTQIHKYFGKTATAVSYGSAGTHEHFRYLQYVNLKIMNRNTCEQNMEMMTGHKFEMFDLLLCATADPVALMTAGNDGGPLIYRHKMIGIHKETIPNFENPNDPRKINVFVSTTYFRRFIDAVIKRE